jgi:kynurenine formamidase
MDPPCHFTLDAKGIDQISVRRFFQGYSIAEN